MLPDDRGRGAHAHHDRRRPAQLPGVPGARRRRRRDRAHRAGRGRARPAGAGPARGDRRGRADRHLPLEPGGLDRDDPGGPGRARGARRAGGPTAWRSARSSAGGRSRGRPTASCAAPATPSARRPRWRASTPTWRATFVLDASDAAEAPAIEALGVRAGARRRPDARPPGARAAGGRGPRGARVSAPATWAVVPAKRLTGALRRLAPALARPLRRELQVAMLRDVFGACAAAPGLAGPAGRDLRPGRGGAGARARRRARSIPTTTRRAG